MTLCLILNSCKLKGEHWVSRRFSQHRCHEILLFPFGREQCLPPRLPHPSTDAICVLQRHSNTSAYSVLHGKQCSGKTFLHEQKHTLTAFLWNLKYACISFQGTKRERGRSSTHWDTSQIDTTVKNSMLSTHITGASGSSSWATFHYHLGQHLP